MKKIKAEEGIMKNMKWLNVILGIIVITASGCAGSRVNLVEKGGVSIERMTSKVRGLYFHNVHAYKESDGLVVSGNVKRRYTSVPGGSGHVDVAIINPEGEAVKHVGTNYSPRVVSKRSHPGARFEVRLPVIPQEGDTVRVAIHKDTFSGKTNNNEFDCGQNTVISR